ncbi:MAG: hypothetical protein ACPHCZ_07280, partial [Candidatus Poseidoniaceae archaeon]
MGFGRCIHVGDEFLKKRGGITVEDATHGLDAVVVPGSVDAGASTEANVHREASLRQQFLAVS